MNTKSPTFSLPSPQNVADPASWARRILFVVTGLTPAVVTESLYALAIARKPAFIPTEIHVLTTGKGAELATRQLFAASGGHFHRIVAEYPVLGDIRFKANHITVIKDQSGRVLDDITTLQENQDAADAITDAVRRYTLDENTALHVSLAGGRKTMGFFAGYALSLFGRPQDMLSHVLVPPGVERHAEFYFPSTKQGTLISADGEEIVSATVDVLLAEIPVVRLRHGIPPALISGAGTYRSVVTAAQASLGAPSIRLDIEKRTLYCADHPVMLPNTQLALYVWLAERIKSGLGDSHVVGRGSDTAGYLSSYRHFVPEMSGEYEKVENGLKRTIEAAELRDWLREKVSRTNSVLKKTLGQELSAPYLITTFGKRPTLQYGLQLNNADILIQRQRG